MRVKVYAEDYGVPQLIFGERYVFAYIGTSYADEFVFTRKNKIEMCEYDRNNKKISSIWISKRELKQIIRSGAVLWIDNKKDK